MLFFSTSADCLVLFENGFHGCQREIPVLFSGPKRNTYYILERLIQDCLVQFLSVLMDSSREMLGRIR